MIIKNVFIFVNLIFTSFALQCSIPNDNYRLNCLLKPSNSSKKSCLSRKCCWSEPKDENLKNKSDLVPSCYYPTDYPTYQIKSVSLTNSGFQAVLTREIKSFLPDEILNLNFEAVFETNSRIRMRITDPNDKRFEVPIDFDPPDSITPINPEYDIILPTSGPFSVEVKRRSDGLSLFKSYGPLLYSDQFIQISSLMSVDHIYGIGEQNRPFIHNISDNWERIGLWNHDDAISTYNNLYSTHSFYMGMPNNGWAYGVYFFNSNAQEFLFQPVPIMTYRTIGGILDIFIFTGGTPEITVQQYTSLIGRPMLPPYWSLGFHLSKFGYKSVEDISNVLLRNINIGIPVAVQWSDIDYMDGFKDFTVDLDRYFGLGNFINYIRQKYGIKYVVILDPVIAINAPGTYKPYDDGLQMGVFVGDSQTKKPLIGKMWPGDIVFPDFTHPNITKYWTNNIQSFYKSFPFDGLWIDANEPSSFYDGSKNGCINNNKYDQPFFVPEIIHNSLFYRTICPSALHFNNQLHYNLHDLYSYHQALETNKALKTTIPNKRAFLLSRSTFSGSGKYTFHWTGDNKSTWLLFINSIRQLLNFNMFGIPMIGPVTCGFQFSASEELCIRWMQVGSFYTFMWNHNEPNARDQDPASWSIKAQEIMKKYIIIRYQLLPTFYNLFVKSHLYGGTVMRPMGFEFYSDNLTHSLEIQFMIGSALLISPVVTEGATSVMTYFPAGIWYDIFSAGIFFSNEIGKWVNLDTPLEKINIILQGGHIIMLFESDKNSYMFRENNFVLFCGLSRNQTAKGDLFWDDGESLDSYSGGKYSYFQFSATGNSLEINPVHFGYLNIPPLHRIVVFGINQTSVDGVMVNDKQVPFDVFGNVLEVRPGNINLFSKIQMIWK